MCFVCENVLVRDIDMNILISVVAGASVPYSCTLRLCIILNPGSGVLVPRQ